MAKTSGELERTFIDSIHLTTGKSLGDWLNLLKSSKIEKRIDILPWLKNHYGLSHLHAQLIAGIHFNQGFLVYNDNSNLLEKQICGNPVMRELFHQISSTILAAFHGAQLIPKRNHVYFVGIREFAIGKVKPCEIRLALDLGCEKFSGPVMPSEIEGIPPGFSHMLRFTSPRQFNSHALALISKSYKRTHNNEKS